MLYHQHHSSLSSLIDIIQKTFAYHQQLSLKFDNQDILIKNIKMHSPYLDINSETFLFGNTFDNNLYKQLKSPQDIINFTNIFTNITNQITEKMKFDIGVYDISKIISNKKNIERYLSENKIIPQYIISSPKNKILIDISQDNSEIILKDGYELHKVEPIDIKNIIKIELINSLFIIKIARHKKLNIRQMMIILRQLNENRIAKVIDITANDNMLSVTLYCNKSDIAKIFSYKLVDRNKPVDIQDFTSLFN